MPNAFVILIWFNRNPQTHSEVEAVVGRDLEAAKEHVSQLLENGRKLTWVDGRSFTACEEIHPTKHYYTIHKVPLVIY